MRDRDGAVIFDLEPEDDDAAVPTTPAGEGPARDADPELPALADPFGAVRAFVARQPRRRVVRALVAAGAVVVLAVGGTLAVRALQAAAAERERVATLLASPGGVRDVSGGPLVTAWSTPVTGPVLGTLPGLLVVADGGDGVALRVADGAEAWRVELGGNLECGPNPERAERAPAATQFVCVTGPHDARRVTVLGPDGVVAERDLGDTSWLGVYPAPETGVLTVLRTGDPVPEPTVDAGGQDDFPQALQDAYPDGLAAGQGAVVTVEDAVTGEQRWSDEIAFTPVSDIAMCGINLGEDGVVGVSLDVSARATPTLIDVSGCGVKATYLPDGTRFPADAGSAVPWVYRMPDPDGGFVDFNATPVVMRDEQGRERFAISGYPALPLATDGPSDVRLAYATNGGLAAVGADGTTVWAARDQLLSPVVARAGGQVIGLSADGTALEAVSLADGTVTWSSPLPSAGTTPGPGNFAVGSAVTDGTTVVVALTSYTGHGDGAGMVLVGVDVRTGALWSLPGFASGATLWTVDGNVLVHDVTPGMEMYNLPDGETASRTQGFVRLLVAPGDDRAPATEHPAR